MLLVQISHLPRSALVEVEAQALTHAVLKRLNPKSSYETKGDSTSSFRFELQSATISRALCHVINCAFVSEIGSSPSNQLLDAICAGLIQEMKEMFQHALVPWEQLIHLRVFYKGDVLQEAQVAGGTFVHLVALGLQHAKKKKEANLKV